MTDNTTFDIRKFFEDNSRQSEFTKSKGEVLKVKFEYGWQAWCGKNSQFFPITNASDNGSVQSAKSQAEAHVASFDGTGPDISIRYTKLNGTQLDREPSSWKDNISTTFPHRAARIWSEELGEMVWSEEAIVFLAVAEPLYEKLGNRWGKEVWAHITHTPDPTFVKGVEETHTKYNSWTTTSGEVVANGLPVLEAVFDTQEEALRYMKENDIHIYGGGDTEGSHLEERLESVPMPEGWTHSEGIWTAMSESDWADSRLEIAKRFENAIPAQREVLINKTLAEWKGSPITREVIESIISVAEQVPF